MNQHNSYNPIYQTQVNTDYLKEQYPGWSDPTQVPIRPNDTQQAILPNDILNHQNDSRGTVDFKKLQADFAEFKQLIRGENNTSQNTNYKQENTQRNNINVMDIPINITLNITLNIKVNQV